MSEMGHKQTQRNHLSYVRFAPKADMRGSLRRVRFVPEADTEGIV
jgi:hypothetical protein